MSILNGFLGIALVSFMSVSTLHGYKVLVPAPHECIGQRSAAPPGYQCATVDCGSASACVVGGFEDDEGTYWLFCKCSGGEPAGHACQLYWNAGGGRCVSFGCSWNCNLQAAGPTWAEACLCQFPVE